MHSTATLVYTEHSYLVIRCQLNFPTLCVTEEEQKNYLYTDCVIGGGIVCEENLSTCRSNDIALHVFNITLLD